MKRWQKETWIVSLFVCLGVFDFMLRFFWLERGNWTCNPGVFWGIELPLGILVSSIFLVWGLLLVTYFKAQSFWAKFWLGLLLLGGSINGLDRLIYSCVLDYLHWPGVLEPTLPHFNIADSFILLGSLSLLWLWFFPRQQREAASVDKGEASF